MVERYRYCSDDPLDWVTEAVMYAKRGLISPRLLLHDDLKSIITYVKLREPNYDYEFPQQIFTVIKLIYTKIGSLQLNMVDYNTYFEFTFFLYTRSSYEFIRCIPFLCLNGMVRQHL